MFQFLNRHVDVMLLAALAGTRDVGVYAVAVGSAGLVWLVTDAVNGGARRRRWSEDEDDALAATRSAARMNELLALLLLVIAAPFAIYVLYSRETTHATDALWALLPAAAVMSVRARAGRRPRPLPTAVVRSLRSRSPRLEPTRRSTSC